MAGTRATLEVNWRSDQGLLDAFDALFAGARLGHEGIVYRDVRAAPANVARRMPGAAAAGPGAPSRRRPRRLHRVRVRRRERMPGRASPPTWPATSSACSPPVSPWPGDPVRPGDIAVLVHRNRDALAVRDALDAAGVPAVVNGAGSVFGTSAAQAWLRLLAALERPASASPAQAAALSPFLGWTAERVALAGEAEWEDLHARLHRWAAVLRLRGVAALLETISRAERLDRRVLRADRRRAPAHRPPPRRPAPARRGHRRAARRHRPHRLAAGAHRRGRRGGRRRGPQPPPRVRRRGRAGPHHLPQQGPGVPGRLLPLPVGPRLHPRGRAAGLPRRRTAGARSTSAATAAPTPTPAGPHIVERRGEELRLAYVALTRARHQVVLWWAGTYDGPRLRAVPAPVLPGRRRERTARRATARRPTTQVVACFERARAASASSGSTAAPARCGSTRSRATSTWPSGGSTGPSTPRGGARPTAASRRASTRRGWAARRRSGGSPTRWWSYPPADDVAGRSRRCGRCRRCWRPCRAAPRSARSCTACWRAPTSPPPTSTPSCGRRSGSGGTRGGRGRRPRPGRRRPGRCHRDAARAGRRRHAAARHRPGRPGRRARLRAAPVSAATRRRGALSVPAIGALLRDHLPAGDPFAGYAARLADPLLQSDCGASCPAASTSCSGRRTAATPSSTTRPTGWAPRRAAERLALPAGGPARRHVRRPLPAPGAALHRGPAPLPALAGCRATTPGATSPACCTCSCGGWSGAATPVVDGSPCGVFGWRPPASLVEALSDLLDRGTPE